MSISSFLAGETIAAGDVVYVSSTGFIYKASALTFNQAAAIGISMDSGTAGSLLRVNGDSTYSGLSGLVPGDYQYVSLLASGQLQTYDAFFADLQLTALPDAYLSIVGRAITTSNVEVERSKPFSLLNPTSVLLLETNTGLTLDAILQEDGSTIDLETV
jgi:hypothetical protein